MYMAQNPNSQLLSSKLSMVSQNVFVNLNYNQLFNNFFSSSYKQVIETFTYQMVQPDILPRNFHYNPYYKIYL